MDAVDPKVRTQINEYVDRHRDDILAMIQDLVRIPTVVGNEAPGQRWIEEHYRALGLKVETFQADKSRLVNHPAYVDTGLDYAGRPNVIGIWDGTGDGRSLILNGHMDVVSPEPVSAWEYGPWSARIEGNRLYGRGAADMKSGLIANYYALRTLLDLGLRPAGKILLESTIEEEAGGSGGALACFLEGYTADGMVIPEPLGMQTIISAVGVFYFRVRLRGKTAHAAQSHMGINAIGKMNQIYDALVALDEERAARHRDPFFERWTGRSCNLNLGAYRAGDWVSTVAGSAEMECRISFLPGETMAQVKREVEDTVRRVAEADEWLREHPPTVEYFGWQTEPWQQDHEDVFVRWWQAVATEQLGWEPQFAASVAGLDNRFSPYFGVPSVCFGPRAGPLHSIDEYVEIDSVLDTVKLLAAFTWSWSGQSASISPGIQEAAAAQDSSTDGEGGSWNDNAC